MKSGEPPTALNARTGLSTPPGRICCGAREETGGSGCTHVSCSTMDSRPRVELTMSWLRVFVLR